MRAPDTVDKSESPMGGMESGEINHKQSKYIWGNQFPANKASAKAKTRHYEQVSPDTQAIAARAIQWDPARG